MNIIDKEPKLRDIEAILGVDRKKRRSAPLAWLLLIAGLAAAAYWYTARTADARLDYVTVPVTLGDLTVTVTATGTVFPTNQVDVSSELSGIIRKVLVDHNDPVKTGQVVAELDTVVLTALVERSRATLAAAKARVLQAQATAMERGKNYDRQKSLNTARINSETALDFAKADYDRAMATVESAKADVRVAEAELKQNETSLEKTKLFSPIDGVVLKRNVEPGQTVATSFQTPILFTLADNLNRVEVRVDVDEADVGKVREGQRATFTVEAFPGRRFPAKIEQVRYASETINNVVTYKAILRADNPDLLLRPGMTATADIVVEEVKDAVLVPNAALRFVPPAPKKDKSSGFTLFRMPRTQSVTQVIDTSTNKRRVYNLRDGQPLPVELTVGPSDKRMTQVVTGLKPGDAVITDLEESTGPK